MMCSSTARKGQILLLKEPKKKVKIIRCEIIQIRTTQTPKTQVTKSKTKQLVT